MNISALRSLFPVHEKAVFLNNAAESPLNVRVRQKLEDYMTLSSEEPQKKPPIRPNVRAALAEIFGGNPDDYALVTSTGVGIGIAASGYNWQKGDNVVVPADEHWNNLFPWFALQERGVEVRLVPVDENQRINPKTVASLIDNNTRILATASVRYNTGFRADLKLLSAMAHDKDALFMVDGIQGAGVFPINMKEENIDIFACGGFKWLLGMPGTGFLYMNKIAQEKIKPVLPGMYAAENSTQELRYFPDARRYETGTLAYSLFHAWTAGLDILKEVGLDNIHARVMLLTDRIIAGIRSKRIKIVSPVDKIEERSAIVSFTLGSEQANTELYKKLMAQNIIVARRDAFIRVSPNFFNTEDEIDRFLELL